MVATEIGEGGMRRGWGRWEWEEGLISRSMWEVDWEVGMCERERERGKQR